MGISRATGVSAVAIAALLGLIGCSGPNSGSGPVEGDPALQGAAAPSAEEREQRLLDQAEEVVVRKCMARSGFEIFTTPPIGLPPERPYGNDTQAAARAHGLGLGPTSAEVDRIRRENPNARYARTLPDDRQAAYSRALNGDLKGRVSVRLANGYRVSTPTAGCRAEAQRALFGDLRTWFPTRKHVEMLTATYMEKVYQDKGYRAALAKWSACMRKQGYPAKDPGALRETYYDDAHRKHERAAALAEASCGARSGLVDVGEAAERRYRAQARAASQKTVDNYAVLRSKGLAKARQILAGTTQHAGAGD